MATNVKVPKSEYTRLKKIDRQFRAFLSYAAHLTDIQKAREESRSGRVISQTELFRSFDFLKEEPELYSISDLKKRY